MGAREFGPMVVCDFSDRETYSQRPGPAGPYFCGDCGATDHAEAL